MFLSVPGLRSFSRLPEKIKTVHPRTVKTDRRIHPFSPRTLLPLRIVHLRRSPHKNSVLRTFMILRSLPSPPVQRTSLLHVSLASCACAYGIRKSAFSLQAFLPKTKINLFHQQDNTSPCKFSLRNTRTFSFFYQVPCSFPETSSPFHRFTSPPQLKTHLIPFFLEK